MARVSDRPAAREILKQSQIIWTCGVAELLQQIDAWSPARQLRCKIDREHDSLSYSRGAGDLIRIAEVWFPLRALVAKRCQFFAGDIWRGSYKFVWRLGCPRVARWMQRHDLGYFRPSEEERALVAANAFISGSVATVKYAMRVANITKEDWHSLRIDIAGRGTMPLLAAACVLTSVEAMEKIIKTYRLEKRDFFDAVANGAAFDACLQSDSQCAVAKFLSTRAFPLPGSQSRFVKIGRSDIFPLSRLSRAFAKAVSSDAYETAMWLVEYFNLAPNEMPFTDDAASHIIVSRGSAALLDLAVKIGTVSFPLGPYEPVRMALEANVPENAEVVLRNVARPATFDTETGWKDIIRVACAKGATRSLAWISDNSLPRGINGRPWFIATKKKLLAVWSDLEDAATNTWAYGTKPEATAEWLLEQFGPLTVATRGDLLTKRLGFVTQRCGICQDQAKKRRRTAE